MYLFSRHAISLRAGYWVTSVKKRKKKEKKKKWKGEVADFFLPLYRCPTRNVFKGPNPSLSVGNLPLIGTLVVVYSA